VGIDPISKIYIPLFIFILIFITWQKFSLKKFYSPKNTFFFSSIIYLNPITMGLFSSRFKHLSIFLVAEQNCWVNSSTSLVRNFWKQFFWEDSIRALNFYASLRSSFFLVLVVFVLVYL
jgi:hypothetical protein